MRHKREARTTFLNERSVLRNTLGSVSLRAAPVDLPPAEAVSAGDAGDRGAGDLLVAGDPLTPGLFAGETPEGAVSGERGQNPGRDIAAALEDVVLSGGDVEKYLDAIRRATAAVLAGNKRYDLSALVQEFKALAQFVTILLVDQTPLCAEALGATLFLLREMCVRRYQLSQSLSEVFPVVAHILGNPDSVPPELISSVLDLLEQMIISNKGFVQYMGSAGIYAAMNSLCRYYLPEAYAYVAPAGNPPGKSVGAVAPDEEAEFLQLRERNLNGMRKDGPYRMPASVSGQGAMSEVGLLGVQPGHAGQAGQALQHLPPAEASLSAPALASAVAAAPSSTLSPSLSNFFRLLEVGKLLPDPNYEADDELQKFYYAVSRFVFGSCGSVHLASYVGEVTDIQTVENTTDPALLNRIFTAKCAGLVTLAYYASVSKSYSDFAKTSGFIFYCFRYIGLYFTRNLPEVAVSAAVLFLNQVIYNIDTATIYSNGLISSDTFALIERLIMAADVQVKQECCLLLSNMCVDIPSELLSEEVIGLMTDMTAFPNISLAAECVSILNMFLQCCTVMRLEQQFLEPFRAHSGMEHLVSLLRVVSNFILEKEGGSSRAVCKTEDRPIRVFKELARLFRSFFEKFPSEKGLFRALDGVSILEELRECKSRPVCKIASLLLQWAFPEEQEGYDGV